MIKRITKRWQSLLLATIAAFIVLVASNSVFAQNKADKYPKPDFSAMEEHFDIVDHKYEFDGSGEPLFIVVVKKKQKNAPRYWDIVWRDADGVKVTRSTLIFDFADLQKTEIGEPIRGSAYAPYKRDMPKVKSVVIKEKLD
jgi:predicted RND superfamily exporter protein